MGFPLLAWPFIIYSITNLSLFSFCSCKVLPWVTGIFLHDLGCHGFLRSGSSSLLLLLSPSSPLASNILLWLLWSPVSFPLPLSGLLDPPKNECPVGFFCWLVSGTSSVSACSLSSWSINTLMVDWRFLIGCRLRSDVSKGCSTFGIGFLTSWYSLPLPQDLRCQMLLNPSF